MPITVEYLAIFKRPDSFCDNSAGFIRLLEVDSQIKVVGSDIHFQGERTCSYQICSGDVATKKQRYFHLRLIWEGDPDGPPDSLKKFLSLLKKVRGTVDRADGETETLWDDLSAHYARKAYPLLHEIENLMRRLIANFMLVTVGREWVDETLPRAVEDAVRQSKRKDFADVVDTEDADRRSKRKDYMNVLHTVDFIHLADFLFAPYSKRTLEDLYARLKEAETVEDVKALQEFVPESNWKRYFSVLVACDDPYLKSKWEKLYELRCKVAHNALMTGRDLEEIEKLIAEVKPKLQDAISKLPKVTVPPEDAEVVAESAARAVNTAVGEFITGWQRLESAVARRVASSEVSVRRIPTGQDLARLGIMQGAQAELYDRLRQVRNSVVHGHTSGVPVETIRTCLAGLDRLVTRIEAGTYIDYLRCLSEQDRMAEVQEKIDETKHEIIETDVVSSTIAETNADSWGVDDFDVTDIEFDDDDETCIVRFNYSASGEQDTDKMYYGDAIAGEAEAVIDADGGVVYETVNAELDHRDASEVNP